MSTQAFDALASANAKRAAILALRKKVRGLTYKVGLRYVADLLEDEDEVAATMKLEMLLSSVYRVRTVISVAYMEAAGVTKHAVRVGELTPGQRSRLVALLRSVGS